MPAKPATVQAAISRPALLRVLPVGTLHRIAPISAAVISAAERLALMPCCSARVRRFQAISFRYLTAAAGAFELNGNSFPSIGNANARGQWTLSCTSSAGVTVYNNGSSVSAPSDASNGLAMAEMYLLGGNFSGPTDYSTSAHYSTAGA